MPTDHNPNKLKLHQVHEARRRRKAGERLKVIASDMGVSEGAISRVCSGKSYASVSMVVDAELDVA